MVDPSIFEDLQARIDEDTTVREVRPLEIRPVQQPLNAFQELRDIVQTLEKQSTSTSAAMLSLQSADRARQSCSIHPCPRALDPHLRQYDPTTWPATELESDASQSQKSSPTP
jgi:hypothetical protein